MEGVWRVGAMEGGLMVTGGWKMDGEWIVYVSLCMYPCEVGRGRRRRRRRGRRRRRMAGGQRKQKPHLGSGELLYRSSPLENLFSNV